MKMYFDGPIFHCTGIGNHHRNFVKALIRKGVEVQVFEPYNSDFDKDGFLKEHAFKPIDIKDSEALQMLTYSPLAWKNNFGIRKHAFCVHEGSKIPDDWAKAINDNVEKLYVPSRATKNLFSSGGVRCKIHVVPEGVDTKLFTPEGKKAIITPSEEFKHLNEPFMFLFVGSWTGKINDRKGAAEVMKAFCEEFRREENVFLYMKISTFWATIDYGQAIAELNLEKERAAVILDTNMIPEESLAELYRLADCTVMPTRGESFGLPIAEAMASGSLVLVTKDYNSGHMDYCKEDLVEFIKPGPFEQCDKSLYCDGNVMPTISVPELRRRMREVFNMSKEARDEKGMRAANFVQMNLTWELAADKFLEANK